MRTAILTYSLLLLTLAVHGSFKKDSEQKIVPSILMSLSYQNVYFVMYMFR